MEETNINPLLATTGDVVEEEENAEVSYDKMTYPQLKKLAAARGLNGSGTADLLIERLTSYDVATNSREPAATPEPKVSVSEEKPAADFSSKNVDAAWKSDAMKIKEALSKQPKQTILVPFAEHELGNLATAEKIPFTVIINGYRFDVKRGMPVEVPQQVAEMFYERMQSEGRINVEYAHFLNRAQSEQLQ